MFETPDSCGCVPRPPCRSRRREIYDKSAEEQVGPYSAEVGITDPPETTYYDVHNYLERNP